MSRSESVIRLGTATPGSVWNAALAYEIVEERGSPGRGGRILVIDDDVRVRRALRALIEASADWSFAGEAWAVDTGLRAAEALTPDVVLLELLLPSAEDGLGLLRLLVAQDLVVVALSIRDALRDAAISGGAAAFVAKGAGADVLLDALVDLPALRRRAS